jgi:hypothetical protein
MTPEQKGLLLDAKNKEAGMRALVKRQTGRPSVSPTGEASEARLLTLPASEWEYLDGIAEEQKQKTKRPVNCHDVIRSSIRLAKKEEVKEEIKEKHLMDDFVELLDKRGFECKRKI